MPKYSHGTIMPEMSLRGTPRKKRYDGPRQLIRLSCAERAYAIVVPARVRLNVRQQRVLEDGQVVQVPRARRVQLGRLALKRWKAAANGATAARENLDLVRCAVPPPASRGGTLGRACRICWYARRRRTRPQLAQTATRRGAKTRAPRRPRLAHPSRGSPDHTTARHSPRAKQDTLHCKVADYPQQVCMVWGVSRTLRKCSALNLSAMVLNEANVCR